MRKLICPSYHENIKLPFLHLDFFATFTLMANPIMGHIRHLHMVLSFLRALEDKILLAPLSPHSHYVLHA